VSNVQICTTTFCVISSYSVLEVLRSNAYEFIQSEALISVTCGPAHACCTEVVDITRLDEKVGLVGKSDCERLLIVG